MTRDADAITAAFVAWEHARRAAQDAQDRLAATIVLADAHGPADLGVLGPEARRLQAEAARLLDRALALLHGRPQREAESQGCPAQGDDADPPGGT